MDWGDFEEFEEVLLFIWVGFVELVVGMCINNDFVIS